MNQKPKIGTLFLVSGWFYDVGMQSSELTDSIAKTVSEITGLLSKNAQLVFAEQIHSADAARNAADRFNKEDIDLLLICHLTWTEDRILLAALDNISPNIPVLMWCFTPFDKTKKPVSPNDMLRSSGAVGMLQTSGLFQRRGISAGFVFGTHHNTDTIDEIITFARSAALCKNLRSLTIGVIPYRSELMSTTYIDEFHLTDVLGPNLKYFSIHQYLQTIESLDEKIIKTALDLITSKYKISKSVTDQSLLLSLKASLALDHLAEEHSLAAIAFDDTSEELHQLIGLRPGLKLPGLFKNENHVISLEADVAAALAMYIASQLSAGPCIYGEPLTYDISDNTVVLGHAGLIDADAASPQSIEIIPDFEYENSDKFPGAVAHFVAAKGDVTLLNCVYNGSAFQFTALTGQSNADNLILEKGYSHIQVRPDIPLEDFFRAGFEIGISQHWAVVHGDIIPQIQSLASILPVELYVIS